MSMPRQKPGRSRQDWATPWEMIRAVEARFGPLDVDLAAQKENAKAPRFLGPERDALSVAWAQEHPWAAKCAEETTRPGGLRIAMLTPASVGTRWFLRHVHGRALVLSLFPRITFEGASSPFPKDCILSLFGLGRTGFEIWRWTERAGAPAALLQAAARLAKAQREVVLARSAMVAAAVAEARAQSPEVDAYELAGRLLSQHGIGGQRWSRATVFRALASNLTA